jgi:hypothetical protein
MMAALPLLIFFLWVVWAAVFWGLVVWWVAGWLWLIPQAVADPFNFSKSFKHLNFFGSSIWG